MALVADTNHRGRPGQFAVGALVATALMAPAANAAAAGSSPRSEIPVFVLDRGRFTAFDTPGEGAQDFVSINNRGQIVGITASDLPLVGEVTAYGFVLARVSRARPPGPNSRRAQNPGHRHQRPRPDRRHLHEPRRRAGSPAEPMQMPMMRRMMPGL